MLVCRAPPARGALARRADRARFGLLVCIGVQNQTDHRDSQRPRVALLARHTPAEAE